MSKSVILASVLLAIGLAVVACKPAETTTTTAPEAGSSTTTSQNGSSTTTTAQ